MRKRASHQLEDRILALGPALYWPLNADDTGDSTFGYTDQSGNGRNGSLVNVTVGGSTSLTSDSTDSSTDFNSTSARIQATGYSPFVAGSKRTFFGVTKHDTTGTDEVVFCSMSGGVSFNFQSDGVLSFTPDGGVYEFTWDGGTLMDAGNTFYWALTYDDATKSPDLYVNGTLLTRGGSSPGGNGWTASSSYDFNVGYSDLSMDGKQAHCALWDRILSVAEIRQLYMAAVGQHRQGLWIRERIKQLNPAIYLPLNYEYFQDDQSGNNYTMSKLGSSVVGLASSISYDPGDSSTDFNGTSDSITTNKTLGGIGTIVGLANRDTSSSDDPLFASQTANSGTIYLVSGGNTMSYMGGGDGNIGTWPGNGQNVAWAVKWNTTAHTIEAFINGTSQTETTLTGPVFGGNLTLSLTPSDYFDGKMSHVAVWDSALTTAQIQHIHDAMRKGPPGVIIEAAG